MTSFNPMIERSRNFKSFQISNFNNDLNKTREFKPTSNNLFSRKSGHDVIIEGGLDNTYRFTETNNLSHFQGYNDIIEAIETVDSNVYAGAGNDRLLAQKTKGGIFDGGSGNDVFTINMAQNITVQGGTENDTAHIYNGSSGLISLGDGDTDVVDLNGYNKNGYETETRYINSPLGGKIPIEVKVPVSESARLNQMSVNNQGQLVVTNSDGGQLTIDNTTEYVNFGGQTYRYSDLIAQLSTTSDPVNPPPYGGGSAGSHFELMGEKFTSGNITKKTFIG